MTGLLAILGFLWIYSASEKVQDLVNGTLLAIFAVVIAPFLAGFALGDKFGWDKKSWKPLVMGWILCLPYYGTVLLLIQHFTK